ncbi:hypothetical protein P691DRAFT_777600 [Macrolepiota fuliginosa MF-IS2]|uniref:Uncharacterized protein n=1 Tax=Macrolepiota fuliginosa MF-IS2 TaxID=1400762 RepID=A0A9P5X6F7_9AGAR|nr:hypothetical protein P691DRAFT_777600 [Macrolepiota fuliginosa MF-IS2]
MSNVGESRIYQDEGQRPPKTTGPQRGKMDRREKFEHGPGPAHIDLDSKDERTISNKIEAERRKQELEILESKDYMKNPLKPAMDHGNKPSRGAEIDAELQREDEETLRKKDKID